MYAEPEFSMYNRAFITKVHEKRRREAAARQRAQTAEERRLRLEKVAQEKLLRAKRLKDDEERKAAEQRALREAEAARLVDEAVARYRCVFTINGKRNAKDIIRDTCAGTPWGLADIIGHRRNKDLVKVRYACIRAVAREHPEKTLVQMGKIFRRDHTSIIAALRKTAGE